MEKEAYRYDLLAVAYIINGGCSNDCSIDFRSMLVRKGEVFFNEMLANPEEAAIKYNLQEGDWDDMFGHCIVEAYETVADQPYPTQYGAYPPPKPVGTDWGEDDQLDNLFPRLCQKFG